MNVGLVIYGSLDTVSGGYLYDRKLVAHLRQCGDEVQVISLPWVRYGRCLLHNCSSSLYRQLLNGRFDVLLQDELNHPSLFALNWRLRGRVSYPIFSIVHHLRSSETHPAWQRPLYRWVERHYLATVQGFIFNSQTTRQVVEGLVGGKRPFVVAYPAGDRFPVLPDETTIVARAHQPGPLRLLFLGNVVERKGLHLLLAAVARLPRGCWQLAVVGDTAVSPAYTRLIQQQIQTADLTPYVQLHGLQPDETVAHHLVNSHLLVVPSSYEGFGIVYLEGMAFGLPALAGVAGAAHELITDGENGFLVADSAVLAHHLFTLHQNRALLADMSMAARRFFSAHPTWDNSLSRIRQFIEGRGARSEGINHR